MILKKIIILALFLGCLNGCVQSTAFLGPAYTLGSTGNIYQAGLSYGSSKAITSLTGKSTEENIEILLRPNKEDTPFEKLVKKQIKETRKKLNLSNQ